MSDLCTDLRKAVIFLEKSPKLARSSHLQEPSRQLSRSLTAFLAKADEIRLEETPDFPAVANLIEGEAKPLVSVAFMRDFAKTKMGKSFNPAGSTKATRAQFLRMAAQQGKLSELREALDPKRKYKELVIELLRKTRDEIASELSQMTAKDLTGLVDANGMDAPRTGTGLVSKSRASLKKILEQIEAVRVVDNF